MSIFPNPSPMPEPKQPAAPPPAAPPPPAQPQYAAPPQYAPQPTYAPPPSYALPPPAGTGGGTRNAIVTGAVVALLAANIYLFYQLDHMKKDLTKMGDAVQSQLDKMQETSSVTTRSNQKKVEELRDQLERARRQASALAGAARDEALKKVDETRIQLEAAQETANKSLKSDISQVKDSADTANTKISAVGSEVTAVKTDLGSTKSELEKTVADLKRASGELDGHSVLIATNGKELSALRQLGERNYFEFTIVKSKQPHKVADVSILLKKVDIKKNKYTIDLTADDKTVEKRDKGVNEPLQFMTSKARQPYELVVNSIKKDTIAGYVSVPKVLNGRN